MRVNVPISIIKVHVKGNDSLMSQVGATWEVLVVLGVLITPPLLHMQRNEPLPSLLLHCMSVIVYFCDACAEMYIKV